MKYSIGLDCGIASVGYAVMELDPNDEPCRIIRLGSRVFDKAEHPKDGSSLALPRREARGTRRRIRRHQHRLERIRYMLLNERILTQDELDNLFKGQISDIYELRCKALDNSVSNTEFARILIHIAQRRGFKSNRKSDAKDKEAGKLLTAVSENQIRMDSNNYRTVGEMFFKDPAYCEFKRNKGEAYKATVSRAMVENEIHLIFEAQRGFKNAFASSDVEEKYIGIVLSQRPFDLGPGEGSPYSGNQIEKMIGECTLLKGEKRAAKATYSFQLFSLWQKINHIRLTKASGETYLLSDAERKAVFDLCHKSPSVTYEKIRKALDISDEYYFNSLRYDDKDADEIEKKEKFEYLKYYHQIRKVLDKLKKDYINSLSVAEIDAIGHAFTVYKNDEDILSHLNKNGIEKEAADLLIENISSFSKFGHISVKACNMLIPFFEKGMTYDKTCESAGLDFKGHSGGDKELLLPAVAPEFENITNPVVRRAVSQTVKVTNAIIREQGHSPAYVNIELARELSKTFEERNDIEKKNRENRAVNDRVKTRLEEEFNVHNPTGMDIMKLKLYDEQNGVDPYTQKHFDVSRLFEAGYVDVDHIVPYSISFDDSYNNKVLTFSSENRQKGNRLPLQYLSGKARDDFMVWVSSAFRNSNKRNNLLKEKIDDEKTFKSRNLNDTKYLSRVLFNYFNDHLAFEDYKNRKKHVRTVSGAVTGYMRKRWGIVKIREDGDLHHALDAAVIACVTDGMIRRVTDYSKKKEIRYADYADGSIVVDKEGEVLDTFPLPYPNFRKELEIRTLNDPQRVLQEQPLSNYTPFDVFNVKPCFVSRAPRHKVTGAAHKDTIRSGKEDGFVISKVPLSKLTLDKDGKIKDYYDPGSDRLLYSALVDRLKAYGGNGKKAFEGIEFHKPKADGSEGPVVKKVKLIEKSTLNVHVRGEKGVADNGSMVRIDIFYVEDEGYYFVPIYVSDTVKPQLPSKACVASKPYSEWKDMKDDDFVFSLYPNDLIKVKAKKSMTMSVNIEGSTLAPNIFVNDAFFYFVKAGISGAAITVENHDGSYIINSLGIKTLVSIEKYTVDPLGNISAVKKEPRRGFDKE